MKEQIKIISDYLKKYNKKYSLEDLKKKILSVGYALEDFEKALIVAGLKPPKIQSKTLNIEKGLKEKTRESIEKRKKDERKRMELLIKEEDKRKKELEKERRELEKEKEERLEKEKIEKITGKIKRIEAEYGIKKLGKKIKKEKIEEEGKKEGLKKRNMEKEKTEKELERKKIVLNYIKKYHTKYNLEALRKKIISSGYSEKEVGGVIAALGLRKPFGEEKGKMEDKGKELGRKIEEKKREEEIKKEELEIKKQEKIKKLSPSEIKKCAENIAKMKKEIAKIIVGQEKIINSLIRALICDGHVLLEGIPGIAKTLAIRALGQVSGCEAKRIQFTVDLLPSDIVGITTYTPQKGFEIIKGPIFANFVIADEINRSPPKCVLGDTPIITENGEISDIKDIVKEYNGKKTYKENNEYWTVPKKKLKLLAFDPSDCKIKPEEVKYLYKQKTSQPYYEVELKSGRKIKTSNVHPFFTLKDGKIETIQANELKKRMCILVPKRLSISGNNKLVYNKEFLTKSKEISKEIERRKKLYIKVWSYRKQNMNYKKIKEKLKCKKKDENLVKTFIRTKPKYLNYEKGYFFSEAEQFGQVHGVKMPHFMTKEFARFMAILIAEGSVNKSYFYLSMKDKEIPELFIKDIKNLFDLKINLLYDRNRKQYRVAFRSDALVDLLKALDYSHLKAGNKDIPKFVLASTNEVIKEFLKLYYECDGCVSRDCLKITTKSKKIANLLSYLLLREGFVARINKEFFKTKIGNYSYKRNFYNLRLYGAELYDFYKRINFFTEKNKKKLVGLIKSIKRKNIDLIPGLHHVIREARKNNNLTHKQFYNLTEMHAHNLENPKNALMHSRYRLKKIAKIFNKNSNFSHITKLINGDFYCDFIKESRLIKPKKGYWLYDFSMKNKPSFVAGFGGIISHNTQSALIEAMQEKQVTIGKTTFKLPLPFFVMATENPLETSGVYVLPEAQIDRFLFKTLMGYPEIDEENRIMEQNITIKKFEDFKLKAVTSPKEILKMQNLVKNIYLSEKIKKYILKIVELTRTKDFENGKYIEWGASPRASIALFIASKAEALMQGRNFVTPRDVKEVMHEILRHRIMLSYRARVEGIDSDKIINEILNKIRVP